MCAVKVVRFVCVNLILRSKKKQGDNEWQRKRVALRMREDEEDDL